MANMYWKTMAWLLTASTPKTHEVPRMGSSTATAFAVNLPEKQGWTLGDGQAGGSRCKASRWEQTEPLLGGRPGSSVQETLDEELTTPNV